MKHEHGTKNKIIAAEEELLLATVDRALSSTKNAQTIGRNGELPLLSFLNRLLPMPLIAKSGHFISPTGELSPQIDVMVLDSRYPLLSENSDGSVLAMLHSVLRCIEIKTRVNTPDLVKIWNSSKKVGDLSETTFGNKGDFRAIVYVALCYRSKIRLSTLEGRYDDQFRDPAGYADLSVLRLLDKDQKKIGAVGIQLHYEPISDDGSAAYKEMESRITPAGFVPTAIPEHSPLSDFYYSLIQDSYYCLDERSFSLGDIGRQFNDYMSWSIASSSDEA